MNYLSLYQSAKAVMMTIRAQMTTIERASLKVSGPLTGRPQRPARSAETAMQAQMTFLPSWTTESQKSTWTLSGLALAPNYFFLRRRSLSSPMIPTCNTNKNEYVFQLEIEWLQPCKLLLDQYESFLRRLERPASRLNGTVTKMVQSSKFK